MQRGYVFKKGGSWFVRHYETRVENGQPIRKQVCVKLADVANTSKRKAQRIAHEILEPLNSGKLNPEASRTVAEFIEHFYLPYVEQSKRPSTHVGYKWLFELVKAHLDIRLRDFHCADGNKVLQAVAKGSELSHTTLTHTKCFLSGAFKYAKQIGFIEGLNPMLDTEIPAGRKSEPTYAYTLEEIQAIMGAIPAPAKTVVAVAAFSGLRMSEIRGLKRENYDGQDIRVEQTAWRRHINEPKTTASKAPVPVLPLLKKILDTHLATAIGKTYIFEAGNGQPLNLQNLARRVIMPKLKEAEIEWHGWHAFRRGLATNLYRLGVPERTIQAVLRHANVVTTLRFYVRPSTADARAAMNRLEEVWGEIVAGNMQQSMQRQKSENVVNLKRMLG